MPISRRDFVRTGVALTAAAPLGSHDLLGLDTDPPQARLVVDGLEASEVKEGFFELVRTGGAHCVHKTVFGPESYAALHGFIEARSDEAVIVGSVAEIRRAHAEGRISFVCGAQAAGGMYGNGVEEATELAALGSLSLIGTHLQSLKGLGLRIQGLCYNSYNIFGSGCLDHSVPLTRAGRRLVEEIHKHQLILDVGGHTGERTSLDAIEVSSGVPIVCTHTNFGALNPNMRNISDRLADAIAETGGVVGMTAISDFLVRNAESARRDGPRSPQATLDVLLDQFDYGKRLIGVDHIGLGPDFVWGQGEADLRPADTIMFPPYSLSQGEIRTCQDFEDISQLPNHPWPGVAGMDQPGARQGAR